MSSLKQLKMKRECETPGLCETGQERRLLQVRPNIHVVETEVKSFIMDHPFRQKKTS